MKKKTKKKTACCNLFHLKYYLYRTILRIIFYDRYSVWRHTEYVSRGLSMTCTVVLPHNNEFALYYSICNLLSFLEVISYLQYMAWLISPYIHWQLFAFTNINVDIIYVSTPRCHYSRRNWTSATHPAAAVTALTFYHSSDL